MREAAIVSAARTPIGKAFRGAFNQTHGATLAGHVVRTAVERAKIDPAEVEDVVLGVGLPEGATGNNLGRVAALRAGLPESVPGTTINRYCASGLQAISVAAQRVIVDGANVVVAGGAESISMVQNYMNTEFFTEDWMLRHEPDVYMPMLQTADFVAKKYNVSRERQDEYALQSQQRTADAQARGAFDDEIVPLETWKYVEDKESGTVREERVTLTKDEGNRPRYDARGIVETQRRVGSELPDHRRQLFATLGWRGRGGRNGLEARRTARIAAPRVLSRHGGNRQRARRDGHRAGLCDSEAPQAERAYD
jgi:acetyl-CoA C-acetyltransferase